MKIKISYGLKCNNCEILKDSCLGILKENKICFYENKTKVIFDMINILIIRETENYQLIFKNGSCNIEYFDKSINFQTKIPTNPIQLTQGSKKVILKYVLKDNNETYIYEILWE